MNHKTKRTMAVLAMLAAVLMTASAYFGYQANVKRTEATNLRDGTSVDPTMPGSVMLSLFAAVALAGTSITIFVRSSHGEGK